MYKTILQSVAWVRSNPAFVLTIVGIFLYSGFRIAEEMFYAEFGLSTSDVGRGYTDTLVSEFSLPLVAAAALLFLAWLFLLRVLDNNVEEITALEAQVDRAKFASRVDHLLRRQRQISIGLLGTSLAVVVGFFAWTVVEATSYTKSARHPGIVQPLRLSVPKVEVIDTVSGTPVDPARIGLEGGTEPELLLLGRTDDWTILYDAESSSVLRVPRDNIAVVSRP